MAASGNTATMAMPNEDFSVKSNTHTKRTRKGRLGFLIPVATFAGLTAVWEFLVDAFKVPAWQIPHPSAVIRAMFVFFPELAPNIWFTYSNVLIGLVCAVTLGVVLAALISNFKTLGSVLTPFINFMCTIPMITFVPLLMLWMGLGNQVKILVILLQAFPIVLMNSCTGFLHVSSIKLEVMQSLRANRLQTFIHCVFPDALPSVFTGAKLSGILAIIVGVGAETTGGNSGLGAQIVEYTQFMQMDKAFACIFYIALFGIALYSSINLLEKKVITWNI